MRLPFWVDETLDSDARRLKATGWRFESDTKVGALSRRYINALRPTERHLAEKLADCGGGYWCRSPACPRCGLAFRVWFTSAITSLCRNPSECRVATALLARVRLGGIEDLAIDELHAALRARLRRAGVVGASIAGGTEVGLRAAEGRWIAHVHLLIADADPNALLLWQERAKHKIGRGAVVLQHLRDVPRQVSYLQKFASYHRPSASRSKAWPYPLPPRQMVEFLKFLDAHSFEDFLFLSGVRRTGNGLTRIS